ncbi:sensor histidine kinase [Undibacterium sp. Di27W]|uniref:sensor histidine kinase n=1 Tax=Undibacterium sp. Di27W TaxID=3413036 RepID=UPI003BF3AB6D
MPEAVNYPEWVLPVCAAGMTLLTSFTSNQDSMLIAAYPVCSMPGTPLFFHDAMLPWQSMLAVLVLSACIYFLCQAGMSRAATLSQRRLQGSPVLEDVHDTLIQGMQGLMLSLQTTASHLPGDGHERAQIETVLDEADNLLAQGRQAMQDEQSAAHSGTDLEQALVRLAISLASGSYTSFRFCISGSGLPATRDMLTTLYQLARVAMINAALHVHAETVEVELCHAWGKLSLRIRDDGKGRAVRNIDTDKQHGYPGVQQMLGYAIALQARLEMWSGPEAGTELSLSLGSKSVPDRQLAVSRLDRVWHFLQKQLYRQ